MGTSSLPKANQPVPAQSPRARAVYGADGRCSIVAAMLRQGRSLAYTRAPAHEVAGCMREHGLLGAHRRIRMWMPRAMLLATLVALPSVGATGQHARARCI